MTTDGAPECHIELPSAPPCVETPSEPALNVDDDLESFDSIGWACSVLFSGLLFFGFSIYAWVEMIQSAQVFFPPFPGILLCWLCPFLNILRVVSDFSRASPVLRGITILASLLLCIGVFINALTALIILIGQTEWWITDSPCPHGMVCFRIL